MLTALVALVVLDHLALAIVLARRWQVTRRPAPAAPVGTEVQQRAVVLVRAAAALDGSGEAKRHQAYAQLIKDFPNESKRVLSRAIEDAVEQL